MARRSWWSYKAAGASRAPLPEEPWQRFSFGKEHAPLAPPPAPGYSRAAAGEAGERELSDAERRFLSEKLGLLAGEPGRLSILRRLQAWDAEVAARLALCGVRSVSRKPPPMAHLEFWPESRIYSPSAPSTRPRSGRKKKRR